jgi:hypothetical protein
MCNCNKQRAAYSAAGNQTPRGMVKVQLIINKPMVLNGSITGRMYVFNKADDTLWVDKRDAIHLMEKEELQVFL